MINEIITWSGHEWLTRQPWGSVHDNDFARANCWYDPSAIEIVGNDLHLNIHKNPYDVQITDEEGNITILHADWGVGLITSVESFGYGTYQIEAKLPIGVGLWPAFWMYEENKCIPEIDIFEGYSKDTGYKNGWLRKWRVESCIHTEMLTAKKVRARSPWIWDFNTDPSTEFNTYGFDWFPDRLNFWINGKSVRKVKDKNMLDYLAGRQMTVIINNHIDGYYADDFSGQISPFIIKKFEYVKA